MMQSCACSPVWVIGCPRGKEPEPLSWSVSAAKCLRNLGSKAQYTNLGSKRSAYQDLPSVDDKGRLRCALLKGRF